MYNIYIHMYDIAVVIAIFIIFEKMHQNTM
jgi:hypothetical protein